MTLLLTACRVGRAIHGIASRASFRKSEDREIETRST